MRNRLTLWAVAALLTAAVLGLSLRFADPFPPRRIVPATGQAGGTYDAVGHEYQRRLAREGLRVDLVRTAGSTENLERRLQNCRLHVSLVLAEARDRLGRMPPPPIP